MDPRELPGKTQRVIGSSRGTDPGPTLVCTAAIHGDEPAGVSSLQHVFAVIEERRPRLHGEFVGIAGNLQAFARDQRYLATDLNRYWLPENIHRARNGDAELLTYEDREMRELLAELEQVFARARGEVHFLDLHTSSANGDPFVCIGDTLRNRRFAERFCVPVILGLEEQIDGSLLECVSNLGHVTMGVEAGQHRAHTSVDHHEAFIWLALVNTGMIAAADVPEFETACETLRSASHHLHGFMEVRHRHPIVSEDEFRMGEGFTNFQNVTVGQLLAHDRRGEVHASESGRILLPLYQGLGSDGFFIAREVNMFWLRLSSGLRWLGLDKVLHWLPGVRRHPQKDAALIIDTNLARWFALEVFHLLGYRKRRSEGGKLVVSRRRFDHRPPRAVSPRAVSNSAGLA